MKQKFCCGKKWVFINEDAQSSPGLPTRSHSLWPFAARSHWLVEHAPCYALFPTGRARTYLKAGGGNRNTEFSPTTGQQCIFLNDFATSLSQGYIAFSDHRDSGRNCRTVNSVNSAPGARGETASCCFTAVEKCCRKMASLVQAEAYYSAGIYVCIPSTSPPISVCLSVGGFVCLWDYAVFVFDLVLA